MIKEMIPAWIDSVSYTHLGLQSPGEPTPLIAMQQSCREDLYRVGALLDDPLRSPVELVLQGSCLDA